MSSRWTEEDLQRHTGKRVADIAASEAPKARYPNLKVQVDGFTFHSKHEAQYWQELRLREKAGEITGLVRQVPFDLVTVNSAGDRIVVATYIADMTFYEDGKLVVADAKGHLTQIYRMKRKWLEAQLGIIIREVYKR